jgi:hypothetical protein
MTTTMFGRGALFFFFFFALPGAGPPLGAAPVTGETATIVEANSTTSAAATSVRRPVLPDSE